LAGRTTAAKGISSLFNISYKLRDDSCLLFSMLEQLFLKFPGLFFKK
jgi:hypothetical protein